MSRRSESVDYAIAARRYARHLQGQREARRKGIGLRHSQAAGNRTFRVISWRGGGCTRRVHRG